MRSGFSVLLASAGAVSVLALGIGLDADSHHGQRAIESPHTGAADARIWRDPGNIAAKDLFWGNGSAEGTPQPPFSFIEEDSSGTKPKIRVRDGRGRLWNVKFRTNDRPGEEVQSEVAATRIVWALGYFAEETYYIARGRIAGLPALKRRSPHLTAAGDFEGARFEARSASITRSESFWSFRMNPFTGTREFSGLQILMTLLGNWDNHDSNNRIVTVADSSGELQWYAVLDWGSTFGRMDKPGWFSRRSRWHLQSFRKQSIVERAAGGEVRLAFRGDEPTIGSVPVDDARWFAGLASQLTPPQLRRAFEAAGATTDESEGFADALVHRIQSLQAAATGG